MDDTHVRAATNYSSPPQPASFFSSTATDATGSAMARPSSPDPLSIAATTPPTRTGSSIGGSSRVSRPSTPTSNTSSARARQEFWVQPPLLASVEKRKYSRSTHLPSDDEDLDDIEAVVGEYSEGHFLYYYARHEDGVVYKHSSKDIKTRHPDLVKSYTRSKAEGTLPPFDPSASYVHHASRVKLTMKIKPRQGRGNKTPVDSDAEIVPETDLESEEDGDDDFDDDTGPARRSTRGAGHKKPLPYSPKKTRTRKVYTVDSDSDDEAHTPTKSITVRKSSRSRKSARNNLNDDDYMDVDEDEPEESDYEQSTSNARGKGKGKAPRKRASRPAYGYVRPVADLEYDDSDEETAPLRAHRDQCEKCLQVPAHVLASKKRKGKKAKIEEFEEDEEERIQNLGGWVRCLKCPVSSHWRCLMASSKAEILKAAKERDTARALAESEARGDADPTADIKKRATLDVYETTEFICGSCSKGGICMGCKKPVPAPDGAPANIAEDSNGDVEMADAPTADALSDASNELLFRCLTCKRLAHYAHLPVPDGDVEDLASIATYYQDENNWLCDDCASYNYNLDKILAWRPFPPGAPQPADVDHKADLPREYLVKWVERSYRRTTWVPHMWLLSTAPSKLKNFLAGGSKIKLLDEPVPDVAGAADVAMADGETAAEASARRKHEETEDDVTTTAYPDAERRIPPAWKTVDRVLDAMLWAPERRIKQAERQASKKKGTKASSNKRRVESDEEDSELEELHRELEKERKAAYDAGEQPNDSLIESVDDWEKRTGKKLSANDAPSVIWAFFKWDDLGYEEASWDSPPQPKDAEYPAFQRAFEKFVAARDVKVPSKPAMKQNRPRDEYRRKWLLKANQQPQIGQDEKLKLMDFQIEGLNWLCNNWWNLQHCILADEMGLGKTVQIAAFVGTLVERWNVFPALVVVPNSTLTNWIREFERWAPKLRVVPFYGEAKARDVIRDYELGSSRNYHVLVTTYESLNNGRDFTSVFKAGRWEVLVVDEGQRLKSDSSLTFRKLKELKTTHRILMTGTPLNNNIRELFNLMNFLDPEEWNDLPALEREYAELDEELVKQLHNRLRRYFLRRTKSEVLPLPPKNEVIVPVSMAPLQKEIYKSILSQNLDLLKSLTQGSNAKADSSRVKTNMNNMLMQLRKCLQHPYLVSDDIEPKNLPVAEAHYKLIDASTKLRLLKMLLPKLKARGHRVLLFSQFVIALNIVEDFLNGEGMKYLRLDGNTKQAERQKGMDAFNKEGSDIFIYLLTTRAGGVGINLWSADTVIIFDPDFNPHQDLQAIARAYRYGQKKTCLVFKLMVKGSAEDRIMQTGKKKLILDHLIVQKMDDEDEGGDDVKSILTYGAKALFEDEGQDGKDLTYSENDIDKLIEKTETEGEQTEVDKTANLQFSFAKVWAADRDDLEEIQDDVAESAEPADSWARTLQRLAEEQEKRRAEEKVGRGARRKAAITAAQQIDNAAPSQKKSKKKGKSKSVISEDSDFAGSASSSGDSDSDTASPDAEDAALAKIGKAKQLKESQSCGLCGLAHGAGNCYMTESSENLAEYRYMLLVHGDDEPPHERRAAIQIIEETLHKRGAIHLIRGQPLHLIETQDPGAGRTHGGTAPAGASSTGPSKRPSPPEDGAEIPKKKKKTKEQCILCTNGTAHLLKDCPIVMLGPTSVTRQIVRLEQMPGHEHTVDVLRKILRKQKKRQAETEAAEAQAAQSSDPLMPMTSDV